MNIELTPLHKQLERHEGLKLEPYPCSAKRWTIGIGRNYEDNPFTTNEITQILNEGFTEALAYQMLDSDIRKVQEQLFRHYDYTQLDPVRAAVLINMGYQMGVRSLMRFHKMFQALEAKDFDKAADEMLNSRWARKQTSTRAAELAEQMRSGEWQTT